MGCPQRKPAEHRGVNTLCRRGALCGCLYGKGTKARHKIPHAEKEEQKADLIAEYGMKETTQNVTILVGRNEDKMKNSQVIKTSAVP